MGAPGLSSSHRGRDVLVQGFHFRVPSEQVATALIALFNGFAIERLAVPDSAQDELLAHAISGLLYGFSDRAG
jgi:hypothetical protein